MIVVVGLVVVVVVFVVVVVVAFPYTTLASRVIYILLAGSGMTGCRPIGSSRIPPPMADVAPSTCIALNTFMYGGDSMGASCGKVLRVIYVLFLQVLGVAPPCHGGLFSTSVLDLQL